MKPSKGSLDLLGWVALLAALVVSASGEYELAHACGFGVWVAAGVPAALDVYAVRAMRAGRDVAAAVGAMIAANALAHLTAAHLVHVSVPLVVAVSALAPLVLWRVHKLSHAKPKRDAGRDTAPAAPSREVSPTPAANPVPAVASPQVAAGGQLPAGGVPSPVPAPVLEPAPAARELVTICGGGHLPVPELPERPRLDTEAAREAIVRAYRDGLSVREAARRATRGTSQVQRVYAELRDAEPIPGQTAIELADAA